MSSSIVQDELATPDAGFPLPGYSASIRELLTIALPLAISMGSVTLMHLCNRLFLTWYSKDALAAVLPSAMWNWSVLSLFIGTAQYVSTFVSQYEGARRPDRVGATIWQGAYYAIIAGVLMTVLAPYTSGFFSLFKHDAAVEKLEVQYFEIVCLGSLPVLLSIVLGCFYSGRQQTLITMAVNFTGSLINILLDLILIFGCGPIPRLGMVGAAWATVIAEFSVLLIYLCLLWRSSDAAKYQLWRAWRFDRELFHRMLKYGLPSGFHFFVDVFGFFIFVMLIGMINKNALAASTLAFNLNTMAFLPMVGLGTAVSILVGKRIGEGHPAAAARTTWIAMGIAAVYMLAFGVIYIGFPDLLMSPYAIEGNAADFAKIRPLIIRLLWFVAIYSLFDAMAIIFGSALRGAGDTRFAMLFSFGCGWLLMVFPTWLGVRYFDWGVLAAWSACTVNVFVCGLGFAARFQQGKWRSMRVIEAPPPPDVV